MKKIIIHKSNLSLTKSNVCVCVCVCVCLCVCARCLSHRWGYAFKSILEVHVRRFNRMWSWSNIRQHRENLKAYKAAWKARLLTQGKLSVDTDKQVQVRLTWACCGPWLL